MADKALRIRLFSRMEPDRQSAEAAIRFIARFGRGVFCPQQCGVYEPYETFNEKLIERYAEWVERAGGEFGFRGRGNGFKFEGHIHNLSFPEILVGEPGAEPTAMPAAPQPHYRSSWSLRLDPGPPSGEETQLAVDFLVEACAAVHAEYGFAADEADFRHKHFRTIRERNSVLEEYVGDDPEHGLPGLYWLNYFGPRYLEHFGPNRLSRAAAHARELLLPGPAVLLEFGHTPDESRSAKAAGAQQKAVEILGESAFFDLERPHRKLSTPPKQPDES